MTADCRFVSTATIRIVPRRVDAARIKAASRMGSDWHPTIRPAIIATRADVIPFFISIASNAYG